MGDGGARHETHGKLGAIAGDLSQKTIPSEDIHSYCSPAITTCTSTNSTCTITTTVQLNRYCTTTTIKHHTHTHTHTPQTMAQDDDMIVFRLRVQSASTMLHHGLRHRHALTECPTHRSCRPRAVMFSLQTHRPLIDVECLTQPRCPTPRWPPLLVPPRSLRHRHHPEQPASKPSVLLASCRPSS